MRALVYLGPGKRSWEEKPKPAVETTSDAALKIARTPIGGTDLDILKSAVPTAADGRTLGHEAVGTVEDVSPAVSRFTKGDRVIVSCLTSCGKCEACKQAMHSHCARGGTQGHPSCPRRACPHHIEKVGWSLAQSRV